MNDCYYFVLNGANTWNDAHRNCLAKGFGSGLASIHSEVEMNKITEELQKHGKAAWIGLFTTVNDNRNFYWTDNSAVDFLNWNDGEPNNIGTGIDRCTLGQLCCAYPSEN